jgi:hypothetical protein
MSPIVIDLKGNTIRLTDAEHGVRFRITERDIWFWVAWTLPGSDDAWLALDRNGNGVIDNGTELFGNVTPQPKPPQGEQRNGFLALAVFDRPGDGGNRDGVIDDEDRVFARLRLWQDKNHNGISEASELSTLPAAGIRALGLRYELSKRTDQWGNQFRYRAPVHGAAGATVGEWAWDVFLKLKYVTPPTISQAVTSPPKRYIPLEVP